MILVTGGAGYVGSHTILKLIQNGYDVVIFDNFETGRREIIDILSDVKSTGKIVDSVVGDLTSLSDLERLFSKYKFEAVLHFASYNNVNESVQNPQKYYYNNVVGSLNLLRTMVAHGVNKIVFSSSAAVYGEPDYVPIDEAHKLAPINPYGMSKMIVEKMLEGYDTAYGVKNVSLRYFNVSGADSKNRIGEWHDNETRLIPNILASLEDDNSGFCLFGDDYKTIDGTCLRDYVNVEDVAYANVLSLQYLLGGGHSDVFNIGTSTGYTVKEVIRTCSKSVGKDVHTSVKDRRAGDTEILIANNKKAALKLGWMPQKTLEDSVTSAYRWIVKKQVMS